ncbi:DUF4136 domain-containing protein [Lacinutrix chionoecetis]
MKVFQILIIALVLSSCAPIYVTHDYEKATNFNNYKTYNFFSDINSGLNELDENRLMAALETKLNAMGLQKSDNASFLIDIKSDERLENQRNTVGVGLGGGNRGLGGGISVGIPVGQANINRRIIVEFVDDTKTGLFWQAISESGFKPNEKPEKREARFAAIVEKMLEGYPPEQ